MDRPICRKQWNILFAIIIFPFISPLSWNSSEIISRIYYAYKYSISIVAVFILLLYFLKRRYIKKKKLKSKSKIVEILLIFYFVSFIINTSIQRPDLLDITLKACLPEIVFILVLRQWFLYDEEYAVKFISRVFSFYIVINMILGLVAPSFFGTRVYDGRYIYLLGERNALIYMLIPALIYVVLNKKNLFGSAGAKFIYTSIFITVVMSGSSTALGVILITSFLILLSGGYFTFKGKKIQMDISGKKLLLIYIIVWILIVYIQNASIFSWFIEGVLGRNLTFTNRTLIWNEAFRMIADSPIYGHGGYFVPHIRIEGWTFYTGHNMFVQNLIDGGIIPVMLVVMVLILTFYQIDRDKKICNNQVLKIGMFSILVSCLMESYEIHYLTMLIVHVWARHDKILETKGDK